MFLPSIIVVLSVLITGFCCSVDFNQITLPEKVSLPADNDYIHNATQNNIKYFKPKVKRIKRNANKGLQFVEKASLSQERLLKLYFKTMKGFFTGSGIGYKSTEPLASIIKQKLSTFTNDED